MRAEFSEANHYAHDHSYLGTLRGLLLYGLLTDEREYIDTVAATYRKALPECVITESGWAPHDLTRILFSNDEGDPVGDPASAGDVMQIALWLALRRGQRELLDDVERIVRARLMPAQIVPEDLQLNPGTAISPKKMGGWGIHGPYTDRHGLGHLILHVRQDYLTAILGQCLAQRSALVGLTRERQKHADSQKR